jgi:hypothetical protein
MLLVPTKAGDDKSNIGFSIPSDQDVDSYVKHQQFAATRYKGLIEKWEKRVAMGGNPISAEKQAGAIGAVADAQARIEQVQGIDSFCGNLLAGSGLRTSSTGCMLDWLLIDMAPARVTSNKVKCYSLSSSSTTANLCAAS